MEVLNGPTQTRPRAQKTKKGLRQADRLMRRCADISNGRSIINRPARAAYSRPDSDCGHSLSRDRAQSNRLGRNV